MIGPGVANPMLWGVNDPLDSIAKIERSLRFRRSAGAGIERVFGIATDQNKWTAHFWLKIGQAGVAMDILTDNPGSGSDRAYIGINASGQLVLNDFNTGGQQALLTSAAMFRDYSGHLPITIHVDVDNPVSTDRVRFYVEDVRIAMSGGTYATTTSNNFNAQRKHVIGGGAIPVSGALDGYLSHFAFVDGVNLAPSTFGKRHPITNQWRPKSKADIRAAVSANGGSRNGWGVNGFFLPFDDVSSLAALGYDRSQSDADVGGNNWAATNVSLTPGITYDSMLDTPTNNFAVLNPVSKYSSAVLSSYQPFNGNLAFSWSHAFDVVALFRISPSPQYSAYFEVTPSSQSISAGGTSVFLIFTYLGNTVMVLNANTGLLVQHNGSSASATAVVTDGNVIGFRVYKTGQIDVLVNGVLRYSSTFLAGVTEVSIGAGTASSGTFDANFGQRPFAYPQTDQFKALCTKNLPVLQPVMRGDSAFVAATDSGSSVAISLAAKAPWADWIRIYKRRDASEGWRWQFSDDQGNYLDSAGTAAKAAMPALSGTSYVGYAMKLSPANGIASGRLVHVNGVADVVIDGLAKARKLVILKSEATGNWVVFHPDLTAGKLLYLNSVAAETTDATISAVTATGFTVAAALPSGTYRWIAMAEVDGFLSLGKYVGNGSVDGPFNSANSPAFTLTHTAIGGTSGWGVIDAARDTWNPSGTCSSFESPAAEVAGTNYLDHLANGFKLRQSAYNANSSGQAQIFMSIAKFPFRYANAR